MSPAGRPRRQCTRCARPAVSFDIASELTPRGLSQRKFSNPRRVALCGGSLCTATWYRRYSSYVSAVALAGVNSSSNRCRPLPPPTNACSSASRSNGPALPLPFAFALFPPPGLPLIGSSVSASPGFSPVSRNRFQRFNAERWCRFGLKDGASSLIVYCGQHVRSMSGLRVSFGSVHELAHWYTYAPDLLQPRSISL